MSASQSSGKHKKNSTNLPDCGNQAKVTLSNLSESGWLIRYADDFVIITDTRAHAEQWKSRLQTFLQDKLKLTLSTEKTLITDVRRKHIHFLGYELKMIPGNSRTGYITKTIPDKERLQRKVDSIAEDIKKIPRNFSKEQFIGKSIASTAKFEGLSILPVLYMGQRRLAATLPPIANNFQRRA